jgi:dienelactone hydrolase
MSSLTAAHIRIPAGDVALDADLVTPAGATGIVLFAHGSGSSRFSRRNRAVAATLQEHGLATLLLDLLTPEEESVDMSTASYRFDIPLLGRRVVSVVDWVASRSDLAALPLGLFGASTGAAAALIAAAHRPSIVRAVVSRGGRPDLARDDLGTVAAPTLLIVGGSDTEVLALNREAARAIAHVDVAVVPGATHLFEEPGALDVVATLAARWLVQHLVSAPAPRRRADQA